MTYICIATLNQGGVIGCIHISEFTHIIADALTEWRGENMEEGDGLHDVANDDDEEYRFGTAILPGDESSPPSSLAGSDSELSQESLAPIVIKRSTISDRLKEIRECGDIDGTYSKDYLMETFCASFRTAMLSHECSDRAQDAALTFLTKNSDLMLALMRKNGNKFPSVRTAGRRTAALIRPPNVSLTYRYRDSHDELHQLEDQQGLPRVDRTDWKLIYECATAKVSDVIAFHANHCPKGRPTSCLISIDGVQETNSGGVSADILSVSFLKCRHVYPLLMSRISNKDGKESYSELVAEAIEKLMECGVQLHAIVADAVAVAKILGMAGHMSLFSCRRCTRMGNTRIRKNTLPARNTDGDFPMDGTTGRNVLWPYQQQEVPGEARVNSREPAVANRTMEGMRECAEFAEANPTGDPMKKMGMKCKSRVLDLPFDVIDRIPAEHMHSAYLGLFERMMKLFFKITSTSGGLGALPARLPVLPVNERLVKIRVPGEFSRRYKCNK